MAPISYFPLSLGFLGLVSSQISLLSTGLATPTCLQTDQRTSPAASNITTTLSSAVSDACSPTLGQISTNGTWSIKNYQTGSLAFNISRRLTVPSDIASPSSCPNASNATIASCVQNVPGAVFRGGWMLQGATNYSISNSKSPSNGHAHLSFSVPEPSSGLALTRGPLSRLVKGTSASLSSEIPTRSSSSFSKWSYQWQSATVLALNNGASPGSNTGAAGLSPSNASSGFMPTGNASRPSAAPSSGTDTSKPNLAGSAAAAFSPTNSGGQAVSSSLFLHPKIINSTLLVTGQLLTTVRSSELSAYMSNTPSSLTGPSLAGDSSGPTSGPPSTTPSSTLATTLAPPYFTVPPSGIDLTPSGTTASSEGVVFGGLLFSLSKNIHGVDLTIPTIKAEVIEDVENTISKANNVFDDLGGKNFIGSCGGRSNMRRLPNPFIGLENLAGDITNIIGCADEVLHSLKDNLDRDTPDPGLTDDLLEDLSTLAGETGPDDDPSKSLSESIASPTTASTKFSSSSSGSSSTSTASSTSSSFVTGCLAGCCPSHEPTLPTDGMPSVTAAPTDFDTLNRRVVPERFQQMAKRKWAVPISKIKNCILQTPNGWPVTTPAYPGGPEFRTSEIAGELGSLTTVSRYYRSTNVGAPACTPTITRINALEWTFPQSELHVPQNEKPTVDHAYELHLLKSFMESVVDQPNGITCSDANAQFFDTGSCTNNRLEPIFGSLPSYEHPDFIVMSEWLNGVAKGWVLGAKFNPQLGRILAPNKKVIQSHSWDEALEKITKKFDWAQILIGAALIINADDTIAQMQKTNNRIYAAFQDLDTYLSQHADIPRSNFGWADQYKTYMDNYVNYRNGASSRLLPDLLANIRTDLDVANNIVAGKVQASWDQWNNLYNSINTYYGANGNGAADLDWAINWEWNVNNVKRAELDVVRKRQACSRPTATGTSTFQSTSITATGNSSMAIPSFETDPGIGPASSSGVSSEVLVSTSVASTFQTTSIAATGDSSMATTSFETGSGISPASSPGVPSEVAVITSAAPEPTHSIICKYIWNPQHIKCSTLGVKV